MSFLGHLAELRKVIVHSAAAAALGAVGGWFAAPWVLESLIRRTVGRVLVLAPLEGFNERLKLAFILGLLFATPFVLYRVWSFVVPGLLQRERHWVLPIVAGSVVLFVAGAACSWWLVVPIVLQALEQFLTPSMQASMQLGPLLSFIYNLCIATGVVFQLPLVLAGLTAAGLVTPGALLRQWRFALVGGLLLTALVTPGDVVSAQVVLGIPMFALYFASVGLSWIVWMAGGRPERDRPPLDTEAEHA